MNWKTTRATVVSLLILTFFMAMVAQTASAITLKKVTTWMWGMPGGLTSITSTAIADVDGDGNKEIVTGGYFMQLTADTYEAQLCVWDALTLALKHVQTWLWGIDTQIASVAVGDVDGDGATEIVTGGSYFSNDQFGQLCVWSGATLALKNVASWKYPDQWSYISSVAIGDVDADGKTEIITADNMRNPGDSPHTQVRVWDGATLALKKEFMPAAFVNYFWISSVAVGDVDLDGKTEIVGGGYYEISNVKRAILMVLNGATLDLENYQAWDWSTTSTTVNSVVVGNVDGILNTAEIITGGTYFVGNRYIAQLVVWDGATLAVDRVQGWDWGGVGNYGTQITSVASGDVDGDTIGTWGPREIVTGGFWYDNGFSAQLCVWNGATLAIRDVTVWKWSEGSGIEAAAAGDVDGDLKYEMVTGGWWHNSYEYEFWTQLCVWDW